MRNDTQIPPISRQNTNKWFYLKKFRSLLKNHVFFLFWEINQEVQIKKIVQFNIY